MLTKINPKSIIYILFILLIFIVYKYTDINRINNTDMKSEETRINQSIAKFYSQNKFKNLNTGTFKIYNIKKVDDKYLVLSQAYLKEGQSYSNLVLLNSNFDIIKYASGDIPISNCISVNRVIYDNNTILFGNFNNTKMTKDAQKKIDVNIKKIEVKLVDGQILKEDVNVDNGYILISKKLSNINEVTVYDENNNIQSSLQELGFTTETDYKMFDKIFEDYNEN